jgi:hypothetical protein
MANSVVCLSPPTCSYTLSEGTEVEFRPLTGAELQATLENLWKNPMGQAEALVRIVEVCVVKPLGLLECLDRLPNGGALLRGLGREVLFESLRVLHLELVRRN